MNPLIWLMRMSRWSRNPPSWRMVVLVFSIIAFALALLAFEKLGLWPDWLTLDSPRRPRLPR